jgi:hypothetical protein
MILRELYEAVFVTVEGDFFEEALHGGQRQGYAGVEYRSSPDYIGSCCEDRSGGRDRLASSLSGGS